MPEAFHPPAIPLRNFGLLELYLSQGILFFFTQSHPHLLIEDFLFVLEDFDFVPPVFAAFGGRTASSAG